MVPATAQDLAVEVRRASSVDHWRAVGTASCVQASGLLWTSQSFWEVSGVPLFSSLLLKLARVGSVTCH